MVILCIKCLGILVVYLRIKFHVPSSSTSLVIANKLTTINRLQSSHTAIYILKVVTLKNCVSFSVTAPYFLKKRQSANQKWLHFKYPKRFEKCDPPPPPPPPSTLTILEGAVVTFHLIDIYIYIYIYSSQHNYIIKP